jgi:hypothetical protein
MRDEKIKNKFVNSVKYKKSKWSSSQPTPEDTENCGEARQGVVLNPKIAFNRKHEGHFHLELKIVERKLYVNNIITFPAHVETFLRDFIRRRKPKLHKKVLTWCWNGVTDNK